MIQLPESLRNKAACAILAIGSLQIIGFLSQVDLIRNLGRMTTASPLPLVFSDFRGLETFSLDFTLRGETTDGAVHEARVTPELYGKFGGPYNRRNVYGAVFAYGPRLTGPAEKPLADAVLRYGFCDNGPLAPMFGPIGALRHVVITAKPKAAGDSNTYVSEVTCL